MGTRQAKKKREERNFRMCICPELITKAFSILFTVPLPVFKYITLTHSVYTILNWRCSAREFLNYWINNFFERLLFSYCWLQFSQLKTGEASLMQTSVAVFSRSSAVIAVVVYKYSQTSSQWSCTDMKMPSPFSIFVISIHFLAGKWLIYSRKNVKPKVLLLKFCA